ICAIFLREAANSSSGISKVNQTIFLSKPSVRVLQKVVLPCPEGPDTITRFPPLNPSVKPSSEAKPVENFLGAPRLSLISASNCSSSTTSSSPVYSFINSTNPLMLKSWSGVFILLFLKVYSSHVVSQSIYSSQGLHTIIFGFPFLALSIH